MLLKLAAVVTMLIDHVGVTLFPDQVIFRCIGRIALPVFVFLMVEGFYHTRSVRKYELRLLLFAAVSEVPFDLAFFNAPVDFQLQNVFFTLCLGLLMLELLKKAEGKVWLNILIVAVFVVAAVLLKTDYDGAGILLVFWFYKFRGQHFVKYAGLAAISLLLVGPIECWSLLAAIPLLLYNGKRGFPRDGDSSGDPLPGVRAEVLKYLFYVFYPAHLMILYLIQ
ncbi:MAG: conjugal transfer protein TraX [Clostridiales bacterium]|nr:conjugal transfer protein TraX [Clostridiales bacterium]